MKTETKILQLLKTEGPMTATLLAKQLNLTTMGIRQHMLRLEESGDIDYEDRKADRGRPTRYWSLTTQSNSHFPDGHEGLTLKLIDSVKSVFGDAGLDQLIEQREKDSFEIYSKALNQHQDLADQLQTLAQLRTQEGYMASIKKESEIYWLLENHCSICAAASQCLSFCRSELSLFQSLLEGQATITREEHIMQGARRCAYRIVPLG